MRTRSARETTRLNNVLMSHGLGKLDSPGTMIALGYLVEDHAHFRQLLDCCEPQERPAMYNALAPHLRFTAKPLDVYIAELKDLSERRQLPVIQPDGSLAPFQVQNITTLPDEIDGSDEDIATEILAAEGVEEDLRKHAQQVLAEATARKHLVLTCIRCTKEATFHGFFKDDCVQAARIAGWQYLTSIHAEVCPDCR